MRENEKMFPEIKKVLPIFSFFQRAALPTERNTERNTEKKQRENRVFAFQEQVPIECSAQTAIYH